MHSFNQKRCIILILSPVIEPLQQRFRQIFNGDGCSKDLKTPLHHFLFEHLMTTKEASLILRDKQRTFEKNNSQNDIRYSSLNIDQKSSRLLSIPVHSFCKSNHDKCYDSTVPDNCERKEKSQPWNKSSETKIFATLNEDDKSKRKRKKSSSSDTNSSSTLSLHITTYENSIIMTASDTICSINIEDFEKEKLGTIIKWQIVKRNFNPSAFIFQNPFEFPRQQNDEVTEPEVSQFAASQRLLHPNESSDKDRQGVMAVNKNSSTPATTSTKQENGPILKLTPCHNSHEFIERRIVVPKSEENAIKIGRAVGRVLAAPNNAIFDCKVLSRNHAVVWLEDDSFFIKDTKSSNGTFINNSRLSNSGDESAPAPLASGDILQLGVEIVDNAKKVASGCIIAMVRFINSQGVEIATRRSATTTNSADSMITERVPKHCLVVPEEQMYQMQQYIYEAKHREAALGQKLTILQEALKEAHEASETNWQAMINEERLLSRIEILESQLSLLSTKNLNNTDLQRKVEEFYAEKERVETYTKDILRKSTEEASEARLRLQEVELALMNVEEQNNFIREKLQESDKELESQKYGYEKLHSNYDVVCQELEIARAANQHLILTAKKEKEAAAIALQNEVDKQDDKNDLMNGDAEPKSEADTVMDDVIPPAPAPPSKEFADISVQVETKELDPQFPVKKDLINLDELLSDKIENSVIEANKENLQFLSETLNSIIDDPKSSAINPLTLQQAVTKTIISVAKKTHEIVETEQKMLSDEKIAELTKSFSNHEQTSDKTSSSQNSISNHYSTSSDGSNSTESSEELISVFPIFSIFILFFYNLMQITTNVYKRAVGGNPNVDSSNTKTGDDEKNVDG